MSKFNFRVWRILLFFLVALSSSFIFRYDIFGVYNNWTLSPFLNVFKSLVEGIGPFIGAILVIKLFNIKGEMSFRGRLGKKSLIMLSIPALVMGILGVSNEHFNEHLYGVMLGIWIILYGILEETGWRGYLHNELGHLKPFLKYTIIGILWYVWHLTFLGNTTLIDEAFIAILLIASSWGIGYVADKSQSIFAAACFHIIGNILGLSSVFGLAMTPTIRVIVVAVCVIAWIPLIIKNNKTYRHEKSSF